MTVGTGTRHALFGALIGLGFAGVFHSICTMTDLTDSWTWYAKGAIVALGAILWLAYKLLQEKVLQKDYQKLISERDRRMR